MINLTTLTTHTSSLSLSLSLSLTERECTLRTEWHQEMGVFIALMLYFYTKAEVDSHHTAKEHSIYYLLFLFLFVTTQPNSAKK